MADSETPPLVVEHLDVKPRDLLLVRLPEASTSDAIKLIAEQFEKEFPENRLVVLTGGIEVSVKPSDPQAVKRIDIAEFRADGYLQEVNRRFLHPLGLALKAERITRLFAERADAREDALGFVIEPVGEDTPPPPPPPTPGLGCPETNRKEAWWERAITWLLSRGEG